MPGATAKVERSQGRATAFWISRLCRAARGAPWLVRLTRPLSITTAWSLPAMRRSMSANARGLWGPDVSRRRIDRLRWGVLASFHDFVVEIAHLSALSPEAARARVLSVEGGERYEAARARGRGVIIVTAHLGSFEVALAALSEIEPRLSVVFQRDEIPEFEASRTEFRERLGVRERPIDGGLKTWGAITEALGRGETVLMQGDRVVGGQRGVPVRFGAGRLLAPAGPAKLARLTGAPLVPAASVREGSGRESPGRESSGRGSGVRIMIGEAIEPPGSAGEDAAVVQRIADALSAFVLRHPEQWITLHRAFIDEDAGSGRD